MKYFIISGTRNHNWIKFVVGFLQVLGRFTEKKSTRFLGHLSWL